ncbi:MAG TPA: archease [Desulfuromonadales bacterium]|nr:archease [Desulfuromonadales bacterium]
MTRKAGFRLIEHTADIGLEAWGADPAQVFLQAALALKSIIVGNSPVRGRDSRSMTLEGEDAGELLVAWLNEIIYASEVLEMLPAHFRIRALDDHRLQAEIEGEQLAPNRHRVAREVKAATYHQLLMEDTGDGWHARVYLDL